MESDTFNQWTDKSKDVPFITNKKCVGNGEEKLRKELDISTSVGGQNSTIDLIHPKLGNISVKDMTNDDCTLGTDGCNRMRKIFRSIINLFVNWILKYRQQCKLAKKVYNAINKKYGSSKITILEGIDRYELSCSNLLKLNELLNSLKKCKSSKKVYNSLKSEYIKDIMRGLGSKSLQDLLNESVQKEATHMKLIIVHETNGWLIVNNISKISCPRITRGCPRINYA